MFNDKELQVGKMICCVQAIARWYWYSCSSHSCKSTLFSILYMVPLSLQRIIHYLAIPSNRNQVLLSATISQLVVCIITVAADLGQLSS